MSKINNKKPRPHRYNKAEDAKLLPMITALVDRYATYGYRRITSLLNRELKQQGLAIVNHKRIYRIMHAAGMLLARHGSRSNRTHDGKVITLHRNTRWCSDTFTIGCPNGDRVHVAFVLDTCDREAIGYIASTVGIDGQAIRDLMIECVEKRFGTAQLPNTVQWLSDNGPCYTSHDTVNFARLLGFDVCTTPSYSPESNGVAEAFVKTFKRDYVWPHYPAHASELLSKLAEWFEHYNEIAPHKGLKMRSPREFIRECELAG